MRSFGTEFVLVVGTSALGTYLLGAIAGLTAVAGFRGAFLLFAPFDSLLAGARLFTLPALAAARGDAARLRRVARGLALLSAVPGAAWGLTIVALPDAAGRAVLGATWPAAQQLVPAVALVFLGRTLSLPAADGFRAVGRGRSLVVIRAATGVAALVAVTVGALLDAARGAGYGLAATSVAATALWWWRFSRLTGTLDPAPSRAPDPLPRRG